MMLIPVVSCYHLQPDSYLNYTQSDAEKMFIVPIEDDPALIFQPSEEIRTCMSSFLCAVLLRIMPYLTLILQGALSMVTLQLEVGKQ